MSREKDIENIIAKTPKLQDALAALIANTRRKNRKLNLVEISEKIKIARKYLSISEIANRILLSYEMVREFTRVNLLIPSVKKMISEGKIKSIDIADRLSKLPSSDQLYVAKEVVTGNLNSDDLRAIVSLRKNMPDTSITKIVNRIRISQNIKEYVAEFIIPSEQIGNETIILKNLDRAFGKPHICSASLQQRMGHIVLDAEGRDMLARQARIWGISKGKLLQLIISGEVNLLE